MINYRLSAAASVYYVMQTSVQTHIHFVDAAFLIFPAVSFQFMPTSFFTSIAHYNSAPLRILLYEKTFTCLEFAGLVLFLKKNLTLHI